MYITDTGLRITVQPDFNVFFISKLRAYVLHSNLTDLSKNQESHVVHC